MRWRLLAFLPPAMLIAGLVLVAASSIVAALETSLDRNASTLVSTFEAPRVESVDHRIEDPVGFFEEREYDERPPERATFLF